MGKYRNIVFLALIMALVTLATAGTAIGVLYDTAVEQQRMRLVETVKSHARLMEAIARFDKAHSKTHKNDSADDARAVTISQIREAHEKFRGFGETGEFTLADRVGDRIIFVLRHRYKDLAQPAPVPFASELAEPMRRALSGKSGTMIGLDYRGETVLAAYEPVAVLDLGIVAKIDLTEIRAPFVGAGGLVIGIAFLSILAGTILFFRISQPMINQLHELNVSLEKRVAQRTRDLVAANGELEAFTYSVSHDLRAPLRAIDGFSQALLEDHGDMLKGEAGEYLRYIREGSQEMARLIDDLLTLSRSTRGELKMEKVNLSEIAADVIAELRAAEPDREVRFEFDADVIVHGDRLLLREVFVNLLGNAWKFTGKTPDPRIEFRAERRNGKMIFVIRDNGAGFDMAYVDKLFLPFQRLHSPGEFKGNGISLSIVQRIVNRHGGRVWGEGAVGKGAALYFEIGEKRTARI